MEAGWQGDAVGAGLQGFPGGGQNAATFGDALELDQHRFLQQFGQLFDDESALVRVFVFRQAPFAIDDQLDGHGAAHAVFGWRRDGLVERIRVQAVAVATHLPALAAAELPAPGSACVLKIES